MGFSVSGATALLLIAFLISFGAFYTATTGAVDQVQDAQIDQTDRSIETLNTEIGITHVGNDGDELTIEAENTGASTLQIDDLSLLVDGEYIPHEDLETEVDGSSESELWMPQQQLTITTERDLELPVRIRLVTEHGIAATAILNEES